MGKTGKIRVGISGWRYKPWRGVFYPKKLAQNKELNFASNALSSIEINGTFYSLQRPASFKKWVQESPADFVFAVKGPRYITHMRRLREVESPLANFLASGVLLLGRKLGPILWQFPPNFSCDLPKIESFLSLLPKTTAEANRIARQHDKWMKDRVAFAESEESQPIRHAMEIRHKSFRVPEFLQLLRKHNIAIVCADTVEWPRITDVTSDFVYCRLHGSEQLYANGYDAKSIKRWGRWVTEWARGGQPNEDHVVRTAPRRVARDVFVYFDNDVKVRAPFDAQALIRELAPATRH